MGWLHGFSHRAKIAISSSLVTEDLSNFPVTVVFSEAIFDEINSVVRNSPLDIICTDDNGTTELLTEIDFWDESYSMGVIHVSSPSFIIPSSGEKVIYVYYSGVKKDTLGKTGIYSSIPGVWDSNYNGVYHMNEIGTNLGSNYVKLIDSTSNANNGWFPRPNGVYAQEITPLGLGLNFNTIDNFVKFDTSVLPNANSTVEVFQQYHGVGNGFGVCKGADGESISTNQLRVGWGTNSVQYHYEHGSGANYTTPSLPLSGNPLSTNFNALTHVMPINGFRAGINTEFIDTYSTPGNGDTTAALVVGPNSLLYDNCRIYSSMLYTLSELRISKVVRSDSWMKLTHQMFDQSCISISLDCAKVSTHSSGFINYSSDTGGFEGTMDAPYSTSCDPTTGMMSIRLQEGWLTKEDSELLLSGEIPIEVYNPSTEHGVIGWTNYIGTLLFRSGYFYSKDSETQAYQTININRNTASKVLINLGAYVTVSYDYAGYLSRDYSNIRVDFLDRYFNSLSTFVTTDNLTTSSDTFLTASYDIDVPPESMYLRLYQIKIRTDGYDNNAETKNYSIVLKRK